MAVIRVEKRKGYTIMSNYHLRDKNLPLKAKGLLSIMLSLPDEWHYNVRGLAAICKEGVTSISSTLRELEQWGYMRRHQPNTGGKFGEIEYIISTRYLLSRYMDEDQGSLLRSDILENLGHRHYDSPAYQLFKELLYDGGDPMEFRDYLVKVQKACKGEWPCWH